MNLRIPVSLILNFRVTIYLVPQVQARLEVNGPFRRHDDWFTGPRIPSMPSRKVVVTKYTESTDFHPVTLSNRFPNTG